MAEARKDGEINEVNGQVEPMPDARRGKHEPQPLHRSIVEEIGCSLDPCVGRDLARLDAARNVEKAFEIEDPDLPLCPDARNI